jgi:superfamily II DNA or RNA helicase
MEGTLAQYVGRLHRSYPTKREVIVYEHVHEAVPVLKWMGEKRVIPLPEQTDAIIPASFRT